MSLIINRDRTPSPEPISNNNKYNKYLLLLIFVIIFKYLNYI